MRDFLVPGRRCQVDGAIAVPTGDGAEGLIDAEDIVAVVAATLAEPGEPHKSRGDGVTPLGASGISHHRAVKRQAQADSVTRSCHTECERTTTARSCCAHLARKKGLLSGFCGARWNRTIDLSIISARHWYRDERLGTSWYSARTGGTGTNRRERPGRRDGPAMGRRVDRGDPDSGPAAAAGGSTG